MEKKFFKYLFLGVFVLSLGISFIGCKEDYDDDIENLDQAASIAELFNKVQGLETSVQEAKTEAEAAKAKAEEALAGGGGDSGQAIKDLQAQIAKLASLAAVEEKLAALETKLMGKINDADISKLAAEIEALAAEIMSLIGHRLTSLSVIPTTHINGIPAIRLVALQYTPQKYQARTKHIGGPEAHTSRPVLDHANVSGAGANYISTEHSEAYYHVSPSVGVRTED
ncbi:hypothetical protein LJC29_03525, partial [Bacteroides sp. OttesenSCG-928-N06]|nr:hypothetical protein [Bacteroides sp. OttesenSCG-928-N06]